MHRHTNASVTFKVQAATHHLSHRAVSAIDKTILLHYFDHASQNKFYTDIYTNSSRRSVTYNTPYTIGDEVLCQKLHFNLLIVERVAHAVDGCAGESSLCSNDDRVRVREANIIMIIDMHINPTTQDIPKGYTKTNLPLLQ